MLRQGHNHNKRLCNRENKWRSCGFGFGKKNFSIGGFFHPFLIWEGPLFVAANLYAYNPLMRLFRHFSFLWENALFPAFYVPPLLSLKNGKSVNEPELLLVRNNKEQGGCPFYYTMKNAACMVVVVVVASKKRLTQCLSFCLVLPLNSQKLSEYEVVSFAYSFKWFPCQLNFCVFGFCCKKKVVLRK